MKQKKRGKKIQQFINSFMGVIGGISLMALKVLGTPIVDYIQLRVYPVDITSTGLTIFGVIYDAMTLISLIGMIITILFTIVLLKNVFKSYKKR